MTQTQDDQNVQAQSGTTQDVQGTQAQSGTPISDQSSTSTTNDNAVSNQSTENK